MTVEKLTASQVRVRPMEGRDFAPMLELYRAVFGPAYAERFARRWQWAHRDNLYPGDSPKWVLADGERVVGFLAAIPMPYTIGGEEVVANTPCDYMVHPRYRFHGVKLMREFFSACPNCVTCDDVEATIKVTQWLGARVVSPVITYVKVLDGRALSARERFAGYPKAFYRTVSWGLRAADAILLPKTLGVRVESVSDFDDRFERLSERVRESVPAAIASDLRFLRWRYGADSPHADRVIITATDDGGELLGYLILYIASDPRPTGYVMDIQAVPGQDRARVMQVLLVRAATQARRMGAMTLKFHALPSPMSLPEKALRRMGFMATKRDGRVLMTKLADPRLDAIASRVSSWHYAYGDAEVSHSLA